MDLELRRIVLAELRRLAETSEAEASPAQRDPEPEPTLARAEALAQLQDLAHQAARRAVVRAAQSMMAHPSSRGVLQCSHHHERRKP